jgi:putative transposase
MPKGVRLKAEQVVAKLREIEVKLSQGKDVLTACREASATDMSYYHWRREK